MLFQNFRIRRGPRTEFVGGLLQRNKILDNLSWRVSNILDSLSCQQLAPPTPWAGNPYARHSGDSWGDSSHHRPRGLEIHRLTTRGTVRGTAGRTERTIDPVGLEIHTLATLGTAWGTKGRTARTTDPVGWKPIGSPLGGTQLGGQLARHRPRGLEIHRLATRATAGGTDGTTDPVGWKSIGSPLGGHLGGQLVAGTIDPVAGRSIGSPLLGQLGGTLLGGQLVAAPTSVGWKIHRLGIRGTAREPLGGQLVAGTDLRGPKHP